MLRKTPLACGILSSLLYATMTVVIARYWPGYDPASQTISELSAVGAPTRRMWMIPGFLYMPLVIAFGWGVMRSSGRSRALNATIGGLLIAYGALGVLWPLAPMHARDTIEAGGGTSGDALHLVLAGLTVGIMVAILGTAAAALDMRFRIYTLATLIVLFVFGVLTSIDATRLSAGQPTPWMGVYERINLGASFSGSSSWPWRSGPTRRSPHGKLPLAALQPTPDVPSQVGIPTAAGDDGGSARTTFVILTVNSGSSSLKLGLYRFETSPVRVARAEMDSGDGHDAAARIRDWAAGQAGGTSIRAVAHRLVHGGDEFQQATVITPHTIDALKALIPLAPNHLPGELSLLESLSRVMDDAAHVGCFDTAFHRTLPDIARTLPLPGVRRFGFHGLSCTFLVGELERLAGREAAQGRVILAHLGSGASITAVRDGRSIDTSMGMTPAGGLLMSTRSGDLDPGAVTFVMRQQHLGPDEMDRLLTRQSGLAAISGGTSDMRALLDLLPHDDRARLAVDMFCYQAARWIGAFAAALGGLDTLVFSAGIGERSPEIRRRILSRLAFLGVEIDDLTNNDNAPVISSSTSRVAVRVMPTDEAQVMARQAHDVLAAPSRT